MLFIPFNNEKPNEIYCPYHEECKRKIENRLKIRRVIVSPRIVHHREIGATDWFFYISAHYPRGFDGLTTHFWKHVWNVPNSGVKGGKWPFLAFFGLRRPLTANYLEFSCWLWNNEINFENCNGAIFVRVPEVTSQ